MLAALHKAHSSYASDGFESYGNSCNNVQRFMDTSQAGEQTHAFVRSAVTYFLFRCSGVEQCVLYIIYKYFLIKLLLTVNMNRMQSHVINILQL